jgi:hypothetical protein
MRAPLGLWLVLGAGLVSACRGARQPEPKSDLVSLVDSLKPSVERAVGLTFRKPLKAATRNRDQLRSFLLEKMDQDLPPERLHGTELVYQLLGMIPDTLKLQEFMVAVLIEQVAGFYDPKTATLYGLEGYDRAKMTMIMAHEMVHALQDQYLPLDSILKPQPDDDRQAAAQAILEGQATLASVRALLPEGTVIPPDIWDQSRAMLAQSETSMPLFAHAPLVIREQLVFPYLAGADFMMWWSRSKYADTLPYGPRMPASTEQILAPDRYERGDQPRSVRFEGPDDALFENTLGDLDLRILAADLAGATEIATKAPLGWGGDRFRVYQTPAGAALVWYIVWDDAGAAEHFRAGTGARIGEHRPPNYRSDLTMLTVNGMPATRIVIAPAAWPRWNNLPQAQVQSASTR